MKGARLFRYIIVLLAGLAALWALGLVIFVEHIRSYAEPLITHEMSVTDGIVVLTGGSERLSAGLELLAAGKGKKLLVSGVHPGLTLDQVMVGQSLNKNLQSCCVMLGHAAADTIGNADETADWAKAEGLQSLRLVTAHYHMPRSLLLFHQVLPQVMIVPHAVTPDSVKLDHWWQRSGTANLLVVEYNKCYLSPICYAWHSVCGAMF